LVIFAGCTDRGDKISYWCEWNLNDGGVSREIVPGHEAYILFPEIVISFLESKFDFGQVGQLSCEDIGNVGYRGNFDVL